MAFKFVALFALVAAAAGGPIQVHQLDYADTRSGGHALSLGYEGQTPQVQAYAPKVVAAPVYKQVEYQSAVAPAAYDFNYAVHDEHTGDIKSQNEVRNGNAVQGRYELIDSDGFRRIVEYTADEHTGFQAVVHREPVDIKIPQPAPREHKLAYASPVAKVVPSYAYPVNKIVADHSAPAYNAQSYSSPAYVAQSYSAPAYNPAANSDPAYSVPAYKSQVYSAPAYNTQAYSVPAYNTQAYTAPAYNTQAYSAPAYNTQAYSAPAYKTQVYSAPAYNAQAYSAPGYNAHTYSAPAYKTQVYSTPAYNVQAYSAPAPTPKVSYLAPVAKTVYSSPAAVTAYPVNKEYYSREAYVASTVAPALQTSQAKVTVASTPVYATQAPEVEAPATKAVVSASSYNTTPVGAQSSANYSSAEANSYATYNGASSNYHY